MRPPPPQYGKPILADQLVEELDDVGIERGVVLSTAYWYGNPRHRVGNAEAESKTRAVDLRNPEHVAKVKRFFQAANVPPYLR